MTRVTITASEDDTTALGRRLGASVASGTTILLHGELGAGKTAFVRGVAAGLGIQADQVSSPTFTLIQEYRGTRSLFHVDLYRISSMEADDLGLDELVEQGVVAIEWAEKLARPPGSRIDVRIDDLGDDNRRVTIVTPDTVDPLPGGAPWAGAGVDGESTDYSER